MGTPIKNSILANLKTTLAGITTAGGYNQTVKELVMDRPKSPNHGGRFPMLFCWEETTTGTEREIVGGSKRVMTVVVGCLVDDGDDPRLALDKLMADVEKALMVDHTRGGYAWNTEPTGNAEVEIHEEGDPPTGVGYLDFEVTYWHQSGDPFTQ